MTSPVNFNNKLDLSDRNGLFYNRFIQTQPIAITVGPKTLGGWAFVAIEANGDTISLPSNFIKYGGDDISVIDGDINNLQALYYDDLVVYYTNVVS